MIVKHIHAVNFMQYEELVLEDIPERGTIGIFGKNEYGKSTVADAISFALFGKTPRANVKGKSREFKREDFVRWGGSSCTVEIVFDANNKSYSLFRKLTASGQQSARLTDFETGEQLVAPQVREVNNFVTGSILGHGFEEYRYSSCVAQKEIELISQNTDDVKGVINKMLGISLLEEAYTACLREKKTIDNDILPEIRKQLEIQKKRIGERQENIELAEELEEQILEMDEKLGELNNSIQEKEALKKVLKEIRDVEKKRESLLEQLKGKEEIRKELLEQLKKAEGAAEQLGLLQASMDEEQKEGLLDSEPTYVELKRFLSDLEKIGGKIDSLEEKQEERRKQFGELLEKEKKLAEKQAFVSENDGVEDDVMALQQISNVYRDMTRLKAELEEREQELDRKLFDLEEEYAECLSELEQVKDVGREEAEIASIFKIEERARDLSDLAKKAKASSALFFSAGIIASLLGLILGVMFSYPAGFIILIPGFLFVVLGSSKHSLAKKQFDVKRLLDTKIADKKMELGRLLSRKESRGRIKKKAASLSERIEKEKLGRFLSSSTMEVLCDVDDRCAQDMLLIERESVLSKLSDFVGELELPGETVFTDVPFRDIYLILTEKNRAMEDKNAAEQVILELRKDVSNMDILEKNIVKDDEVLSEMINDNNSLYESIENRAKKLGLCFDDKLEETIDEKLSQISEIKDKHKMGKGEIKQLEKQRASITDTKEKLKKVEEEISRVRTELGVLPPARDYKTGQVEALENELKDLQKQIEEHSMKRGKLSGTVHEKKGDEKTFKKILKEQKKIRQEIEVREYESENWKELRSFFKALQEDIRNELTPQLQQYFSWILPRITVDRYKMVQVADDFKMQIFSEEKGDFISVMQLSGGTRDQLLLALRLGFARALNSAHSKDEKLFIFLDEPFSSFDKDRRDAFIEFIKNFENTFQQIFLISHTEGLENQVDHHIRVEKDSEGISYATPSWMA